MNSLAVRLFFSATVWIILTLLAAGLLLSDLNKKKTFRSINNLSNSIEEYSSNLKVLTSDTDNIIEYVENNSNTEKKKFYFWKRRPWVWQCYL